MGKLLIVAMLGIAAGLHAEESLPAPPANYSWQELSGIKSFLLKPNGWHFKESKKGQTKGFFITREDISKSSSFQTGLTLNCIRDVPRKSGQSPSAYAASLADAAADKHPLTRRSSSNRGPFRGVIFRYVDEPAGQASVTVHQVLVANDKTGTLFIAIFEAPTKDWDEAWKTGEVILKKMLLDDGI